MTGNRRDAVVVGLVVAFVGCFCGGMLLQELFDPGVPMGEGGYEAVGFLLALVPAIALGVMALLDDGA